MEKYLISTMFLKEAQEIAMGMGLKREQWRWVPSDRGRKEKLLGSGVSDKKYLIGTYTDKEIEYLVRPRSKKIAF